MRNNSRFRGLPLVACTSLFLIPKLLGFSASASAAELGSESPVEDAVPVEDSVPIEDEVYDYGDADYIPPSPIYYAFRGSVTASDGDVGTKGAFVAGVDLEQMYELHLMRLEIELSYLHQPVTVSGATDAEASGVAGFVSVYRDLGEFYSLRPYIGAGVGVAQIEFDAGPFLNDESAGIAWHATTGISMDWTERTTVDFGYRYTGIEGLNVTRAGATSDDSTRLDQHSVFAGVRFRL